MLDHFQLYLVFTDCFNELYFGNMGSAKIYICYCSLELLFFFDISIQFVFQMFILLLEIRNNCFQITYIIFLFLLVRLFWIYWGRSCFCFHVLYDCNLQLLNTAFFLSHFLLNLLQIGYLQLAFFIGSAFFHQFSIHFSHFLYLYLSLSDSLI